MLFYYITILLIPFGNHPLLSYNVGGITPIKLFGGLSLLAAFLEMGKRRGSTGVTPVNKYFILLTAVFFMSVLANSSHSNPDSTLRFVSIIIFFITTTALVNTRERFLRSILLTLVCMDIAALYMFREYSLYGGIYSNFRPSGILGDPNYTALNLLTVIPILIFLVKNVESNVEKLFIYGSLALNLAAVGLSQSRGGFIALGVELLLIALVQKMKIKSMLGFMILLLLLVSVLPVNIASRFNTEDNTGVKASTESRYQLVITGLFMFKENPLLGVGPGNFKAYSDTYNEEVSRRQIAHNSYLELAAELGVGGLFLYILIAQKTLKSLNELRQRYIAEPRLTAITTGIRIGLIGYLIAAIFLSAEFEKIYWFLVFLTAAAYKGFIDDSAEEMSQPELPISNKVSYP